MHGAVRVFGEIVVRPLAESFENLIFVRKRVKWITCSVNRPTMKKEKIIWLVTTEHKEENLWFRDDEDFKVGMNYVAVQVAVSNVKVLVFILMSNHIHIVLYGTWEQAVSFVNGYKMRYAKYVQRKYGVREFLRKNRVDIREIPEEEDEAVERAVAYVQMNCVAGVGPGRRRIYTSFLLRECEVCRTVISDSCTYELFPEQVFQGAQADRLR